MTISGAAIATYQAWLIDQALPRWAQHGFDPAGRRFRERLDFSAAPIDAPHRAMVQARQIFVFAEAAQRGWLPEGGRLAEMAMASLMRDFAIEDAAGIGFAFSVDISGRRISESRDAYTHAFVLFSLAALYRLAGDPRLLETADRIIHFIDTRMTDHRHGGLFDALPQPLTGKRQNPHMHLLEAYLFLDRAAPGRGYLDRAADIVDLFERRMFDRANSILPEYFHDDWSPHAEPGRSRICEPGHHFEWAWLLHRFAEARDEQVRPTAHLLHEQASRYGILPTGFVGDQFDRIDRRITRASARIWPHTEAIKAATARYAMGDPGALPMAETMAETLLGGFLGGPFPGGWIDHISEYGKPLVDYVPASTLYHLFLAAAEASDIFDVATSARAVEHNV